MTLMFCSLIYTRIHCNPCMSGIYRKHLKFSGIANVLSFCKCNRAGNKQVIFQSKPDPLVLFPAPKTSSWPVLTWIWVWNMVQFSLFGLVKPCQDGLRTSCGSSYCGSDLLACLFWFPGESSFGFRPASLYLGTFELRDCEAFDSVFNGYGYRGASACSVLILGRESSKQEAVNSAVTVTL